MTSASLLLTGALLLGAPGGERQTPVLTPTQPQPGDPAIAPAHVDADRAGPEPMPGQPIDPEPIGVEEPSPEPQPTEPEPTEPGLPSWQTDPAPTEGPSDATPIADWTAPLDPEVVAASKQAPPKGWGLWAPAIGTYGMMITTQLITGLTCEPDVYCGTRGWPWRAIGFATVAFAGGGGWLHGGRIAWDRVEAGLPAKNPIGRRAAGWSMFALGLAGMITDTVLYQICYDDARGPYTEIDGFRYTCSPVISVVTLDLSTLVGATGLALALTGESQIRKRKKLDVSVAPWGGRGQAGLTLAGRF